MAAPAWGSLPFAEQIQFLRAKVNLPTRTWRDIWQGQHDTAFVVAGAQDADLLADLRAAVARAIEDGITLAVFRDDFEDLVARRGWTGWTGEGTAAGRAWRTRVIYETNLRASYQAGRHAQQRALADRRPYWRYRHNPTVVHPREDHVDWDGLILRADDPWWQVHYPPNGWGCFAPDTPVRCNALLGLKTWYAGEMVQVRTAGGAHLSCTANHPVLTRNGWVPAHTLQEGDDLLRAAGDVDAVLPRIVDDEQAPSSAEKLFETLAAQGLRVVPMAPHDFHGDALLRKPEIHIAGADGVLVDVRKAALGQFVGQDSLDGAQVLGAEAAGLPARTTNGNQAALDSVAPQNAAHGRLGNAQTPSDFCLTGRAGPIERQDLSLELGVAGVGGGPGCSELPRNGILDAFDGGPLDPLRLATAAQFDPGLAHGAPDGRAATSGLFCQLVDAFPSLVAVDQVAEILKYDRAGHVYDFVTSSGLILAGGIVVSNCRCRVESLAERDLEQMGERVAEEAPTPADNTDGIDAGWAYTPGATRLAELRAIADRKRGANGAGPLPAAHAAPEPPGR